MAKNPKPKTKKETIEEEISKEIPEEILEEIPETVTEEVLEDDVEEVEKKELDLEEESYKESLIRLQADFSNYKKRTEKEKSDIYKYADEDMLIDMLATLDNFERALASVDENQAEEGFCKGMDMIYKSLLEVLKKHGLAEIEALNSVFTPSHHNAVMQVAAEGVESGIVIEVFQKGYCLKEKVIRPSMVKVSQ